MHVVVIFLNIGGYHAARLRATACVCAKRGWGFTAIQIFDSTAHHPWGDLENEIKFPLKTLIAAQASKQTEDFTALDDAPKLLEKILDELQPGAVAIPGWGDRATRLALKWCTRHHAKAILMSESKRDDAKRNWLKEQIKSLMYVRRFDAALVGGKPHKDYLIELGFNPQRIFTGYDAVDNDYFAVGAERARSASEASRARQPLIPNRPYFMAATRLLERKNIRRLVYAFAAYRECVGAREAWDLVVCGSGAEETIIRKAIDTLKLNDVVHLPGFVAYKDVVDWYGLAQAFVHPALQEQWGLVVNEACAAGLPVLCSRRVGACRELVRDGVNGLTFNPEDESEITEALTRIHQTLEAERRRMGAESRRIVAAYSPENFAVGMMNAIDAAHGKSR